MPDASPLPDAAVAGTAAYLAKDGSYFQGVRADYVAAFLDHLANWDFANANLAASAAAMNEPVEGAIERGL